MSAKKARKRKQSDIEQVEVNQSDDAEDVPVSDEEGGIRIDDIYVPPPPKAACSVNNKGPRLIITKIVNHFFKSYAGAQPLGPFHKCFNAIVGPNGSGKSNVIDSMLFVFGYRASKIRSKKISVLLHNSDLFRNVQSCTVAVHFALIIDKEGNAYDTVPGSQFIVSRTAHKDNSSYYQINDRRVQFKEVSQLLRAHGIDLDHNRFLILQGEVEQIAMMKCKAQNEHETGMLEYLEDIIGTSRFKTPLVQLADRVELLAEQRSEKLNRVKLVEKELQELQAPMEEAVGFLKLENSVVTSKNFLYQKNIRDLEVTVKETEQKKAKVAAAQSELSDELAALHAEKVSKENVLKAQLKKYNSLEKKREELKEAFDKANNLDTQLQANMTQLNATRKKTKELLDQERKKLAELERVPEQSEQGIAECEGKEAELSTKKEELDEQKTHLLANLRNETKELQGRKEILQTDLVELTKTVDETKSAFALAESELKISVSNEENERNKVETLRSAYDTAQQTVTQRTEAVKQLKKKIPLTEKSLNEADRELNAVKQEEAEIINGIRSKRARVEETRAAMQASRSRGRVLDSLVQQKREGNCPGLFGRLGDLGAIDLKYDVAVSTACGPLDNIVVDTVNTAQWCIEFLKQYDVGRATFIALEKQEHLRKHCNFTIKTPESVHRLFDLIRVEDERVKTAFYYALRDTLVAKDLEQATRIAYGAQRYRVVTLGGDLIETTGTMSGGGKTVSRGRMGQSVSVTSTQPEDMQDMETDLEALQARLLQLRQQQVALESQVNVLEPELRQMKIDLEKFSIELQSLKQQQPALANQLKAQEAKSKATKTDPAVVKKLTATVSSSKARYETAAAAAGQVQEKVDAITKEIKERTVGKMKAIDKKINDVTKTIDKCKAEITRLRVAVKTAHRNAQKSKEKIGTMEQDVASAETRLRSMKTERQEIERDAEQLLLCIQENAAHIAEEEDGFGGIKQEVAELTKQENKLKSDKIEVDQEFKTIGKAVSDQKAHIQQWRVKLTNLKLQDISGENIDDLVTYAPEELDKRDIQNVQRDLHHKEEQIRTTKPNLNAIQEYRKKQAAYVERSKELNEISDKKAKMQEMLESLKVKRRDEFAVGYNIIKMKLKEMYQMITLGGDADFEMVDTFDPFTEGIQFNVRPPKKSWKNISNLSGGEKTLSSLALVFALHYYKPSPLYVMDEIDAALDFKNVSIVGNYIKDRTKNAQFIIISLRSQMFELCDYLIGIYKTYNCTKSLTIEPGRYDINEINARVMRAANQNHKTPAEITINNDNVYNINRINNESDEHTDVDSGDDSDGPSTRHRAKRLRNSAEGQIINDTFESGSIEDDDANAGRSSSRALLAQNCAEQMELD